MTKTLLDGPGRVLESVYPRFLVDLAQGDDARLPQAHQQQFRERLMQELLARVQLQTWTNGGMLNAPLSLRLTMVEKRHCCKVSDEAAFCLIQRPYISKTLLTRRISPRG
ncbi:YjcZ-like family protein, partial [Escherichia coli]|uniref:YjcZ-like family protein n=1 Tax=Escherichia coli TaxID=562 RepID=UPI0020352AAC